MSRFYITTAIAYVNDKPHIGHALEYIQADAYARFHRDIGDKTFFLTGTDEHGTKIYQAAKEAGEDVAKFAESNAKKFKELKSVFNLSYDRFIRTTDESHGEGAKELWKRCEKDIYKKVYRGYYCVGHEAFHPDSSIVDGECPDYPGKKLEEIEEENYFFKLSKYAKRIAEAISNDELRVIPRERKNEILSFIDSGLEDFSISRPEKSLPWGVEVPEDPEHVMYVWFDALSNYITAVGFGDKKREKEFKELWPADLHLIGKDILRFHAAYWPGMLLAADLPLPKAILVHGFVTSEGKKMSKSLGNVVDPVDVKERYGTDALRYFLLREIGTTADGDFSEERFVERYNSDLANDLGNLVSRLTTMLEKFLGGSIPHVLNGERSSLQEAVDLADKEIQEFKKFFDDGELHNALTWIWERIRYANRLIDEKKPWEMAKGDIKALEEVLTDLTSRVLDIAWFLRPFTPETAELIAKTFSGDRVTPGKQLFPRLESGQSRVSQ